MEQPGRAGQQGRAGRAGRPGGLEPLQAGDPQRIGDYRLIRRLGEGGMGKVFLARSDRGRTVAVKLVRGELADQEEFRARFRREVRAAQQVGGEWTAPVLDADTEAKTPWVATGYIAGPSLQQVVAGSPPPGTRVAGPLAPLPERTVRILAAGLARALQAIHAAGIVHRDLKPSNVLLTLDGPRVIDFGIARALEAVTDNGLTRTGATVGSPGFMAPEQVRGQPIGPACDVFSLGSVLMYAATGRQPFGTAESGVHAVMYRIAQEEPDLSALPQGLHALVAACLTKDPAQRPTPAQLLAMTEGSEAEHADEDEPWLPGALVARLGRHAVALLEAENPEGDADPRAADGPGAPFSPHPGAPPAATPHTPPPSSLLQGPDPYASPPGQYGYVPVPPTAPGTHRPPRRRRGGSTLITAVALVVAAAGAVTAYLLLNGDDEGVRPADAKDKTGQAIGKRSIPSDYLGTWETTVGADAGNIRRFTLKQGAPGDTVLTMTATGESFRCEFKATLEKAGPPVRLGPSKMVSVSGAPGTCSPGAPSTLEMVGGKLRRTMDDGQPPLTYSKAG
ncbi:serine/threonine-protein kinase [Streptomyces sp. NPDC101150]|uniref:serine/threonine-protein kinase n=1 Tax=Streptomyces sp. NPDC101150 TaxID=3366114 RepID=UPI0037F32BB7